MPRPVTSDAQVDRLGRSRGTLPSHVSTAKGVDRYQDSPAALWRRSCSGQLELSPRSGGFVLR